MVQHNEDQVKKWLDLVAQPFDEAYALFLDSSTSQLGISLREEYNWEVTNNDMHLLLIDIFDVNSTIDDLSSYEGELRSKIEEYLKALEETREVQERQDVQEVQEVEEIQEIQEIQAMQKAQEAQEAQTAQETQV